VEAVVVVVTMEVAVAVDRVVMVVVAA